MPCPPAALFALPLTRVRMGVMLAFRAIGCAAVCLACVGEASGQQPPSPATVTVTAGKHYLDWLIR